MDVIDSAITGYVCHLPNNGLDSFRCSLHHLKSESRNAKMHGCTCIYETKCVDIGGYSRTYFKHNRVQSFKDLRLGHGHQPKVLFQMHT